MSVTLVFSYQFPGRYAMNVLAGALERSFAPGELTVSFPRHREALVDSVRAALAAGGPVVVAWSFYSPSFPAAADELRALRAELPDGPRLLTIAGGVHATAEPLETLRAGFDLVCVGEGERALVDLVRRSAARPAEVTQTPGFARLVDGVLVSNPRPARIELDEFPPFSLRWRRFGAIEVTRGCVYACRFCQTPFFSKASFRHRSVEDTARWARALRDAGLPDLRFVSPTALSYGSDDESVNLAAVEALLASAREAVRDGRLFFGTFPSEVRPEHVTVDSLALLKRYVDNDNLIIGGQSGSDRVLRASRRGHDVEAVVRATRLCLQAGFLPNVDFVLGLPGETPDDVRATVTLMKELAATGARVHGHTFLPLPGTPFRDAPPGRLDEWTRVELERLASQRRLYGNWKQQARVAQALVERRDARRG